LTNRPGSVALAAVCGRLRCPVCAVAGLTVAGRAVVCAAGHSHDISRQGHVTLLAAGGKTPAGDTEAMVAAREAFLGGGHYAPIAAALGAAARRGVDPDAAGGGCVVDLGGGTGYHLAAVIGGRDGWHGIALDASRPALRRAVRADPGIAGVVCDVWRPLPVGDGAADLVLSVFSPRNAPEIARILGPRGTLVVVTPGPDHLGELVTAGLGMITVDRDKPARLHAKLSPDLRAVSRETLEFELALDHPAVRAAALMGPGAHHIDPDELGARVAGLPEPVRVTASVRVETFRAI
jgi:23S rRNA (guanine745-N1)-methyltransferase